MYRTAVLVFLGGILCQNPPNDEEEMVGLGELTKLRLAAARAKVRQGVALAKIRAHRIPHLLLAENPNYSTNSPDLDQDENYSIPDRSNFTSQHPRGFYSNLTNNNQRTLDHGKGDHLTENMQIYGKTLADENENVPTTNRSIIFGLRQDSTSRDNRTAARISNNETSFTRLRGIKNNAKDEQLFVWSLNNMQYQHNDGLFREAEHVTAKPKMLKYYSNLQSYEKSKQRCQTTPVLYITKNENFETIYSKFDDIKRILKSLHNGNCPGFATGNVLHHRKAPEAPTLLLHQDVLRNNQETNIEQHPRPNDILGKPYMIQIPRNNVHHNIEFRRSSDRQRNAPHKTSRHERSLPLLTLIADPDAKLDIYKTAENIGTVARNSLDDDKAPLLHAKNLLVSAKNALLSILRIPPQNVIIPSQYKITDKTVDNIPSISTRFSDVLTLENPEDRVQDTFQKLGAIFKKSIKSGRETLQHMGDAAHSARKVIITTRQSAPKMLIPYAKTPVLKNNNVLLTSRFGDVENEMDDCVGLGNIMDALGISNPENKKITFRSRFGDIAQNQNSNDEIDSELEPRHFNTGQGDGVRNYIHDAVDKLRRLKKPKTTKDSSLNRFNLNLDNKLDISHKRDVQSHDLDNDPELNQFLTELFTGRKKIKNFSQSTLKQDQMNSIENTVGSGLPLTKNLLEPFMGAVTKPKEMQTKKHGSKIRNAEIDRWRFEDLEDGTNRVGKSYDETSSDAEYASDESKETRMSMCKSLLKPFMGKISRKKIYNFLNPYRDAFLGILNSGSDI